MIHKVPETPEELEQFIRGNWISYEGDQKNPTLDDKIYLSVHDLLSAFSWWSQEYVTVKSKEDDVLLTHEQICSLWQKFDFDEKLKIVTFARAIERAHGIGRD